MTGFGDVNVGDKVRLTSRQFSDTEVVFRVLEANYDAAVGALRSKAYGWHYSTNWSVEVLEPAPKPLPTDGVFVHADVGATGGPVVLVENGGWKSTSPGMNAREKAEKWNAEGKLERLVPVSAVEEARTKVVKEIVARIRQNCTLDYAVTQKGVDYIVYGVADWIENPPEWIKASWVGGKA